MYNRFKKFLKRSRHITAIIDILRHDIQKCHRVKWYFVRSRAIKSYLESSEIKKLQIGTGPNFLKGWLNTDLLPRTPYVYFLDATKSFPFEDCIFDYIFSEHLIEHLKYDDGLRMFRECYRICKPGGRIRISTPNLEQLVGLHTKDKSEIQQRYIKWITDRYLPERSSYNECFVINNAFKDWGHEFIYDRETLQAALEESGFVDVTHCQPQESDQEVFKNIESHGNKVGDEDMNRFETMVIEAKRPLHIG